MNPAAYFPTSRKVILESNAPSQKFSDLLNKFITDFPVVNENQDPPLLKKNFAFLIMAYKAENNNDSSISSADIDYVLNALSQNKNSTPQITKAMAEFRLNNLAFFLKTGVALCDEATEKNIDLLIQTSPEMLASNIDAASQGLSFSNLEQCFELQKIKEGAVTIDHARETRKATVNNEINIRLETDASLSPQAKKILGRCQRGLLDYFVDGMLTIDLAATLTDEQVNCLKTKEIQELIAAGELTVIQAIRLTPDQVWDIHIFKAYHLSLEKMLTLTEEQRSVRMSYKLSRLYSVYIKAGMLSAGQVLSLNLAQANVLIDRIATGKLTTEQQVQQAFMNLLEQNGITNPSTIQKIKEGTVTIDRARKTLETVLNEINTRLETDTSLSPQAKKILQRCRLELPDYFVDGMLTIDLAATLTDEQVNCLKTKEIQELIAGGKLTVIQAIRLTPDQVRDIQIFKAYHLSLEKMLTLTEEQRSVRMSYKLSRLYSVYIKAGMLSAGQVLSLNLAQANVLIDRIATGKLTTEQQIQQAFMDVTNLRN